MAIYQNYQRMRLLFAPQLLSEDAEKPFVGWGTGHHECEFAATSRSLPTGSKF